MRLLSSRSKLINFFLPSTPQVFGFLVFSLIIKNIFGSSSIVNERLHIYQIATSISSLFFLGVSYSNYKLNIKFRTLLSIVLVSIFCCFFLSYNRFLTNALIFSNLIVQVFLNSKLLHELKKVNYIFYLIIISIVLPQLLWINNYLLAVLLLMQLCFFHIFTLKVTQENVTAKFGLGVFTSIIFQAPLMISSFFDPLIIEVIGENSYKDYVLFSKFFNGLALLSFSKLQLDILFDEFDVQYLKKYLVITIITFVLIFLSTLIHHIFFFYIQILLFSVFINLVSIIVRINLKLNKSSLKWLVLPLISVFVYFSFFYANLGVVYFKFNFLFALSSSYLILLCPNFYNLFLSFSAKKNR